MTHMKSSRILLLVGTRKGAFVYHGDASRRKWNVDGPHFLGQTVFHLIQDPRDGRTLLMAAKTGHLGPTVSARQTWEESGRRRAVRPNSPRGVASR